MNMLQMHAILLNPVHGFMKPVPRATMTETMVQPGNAGAAGVPLPRPSPSSASPSIVAAVSPSLLLGDEDPMGTELGIELGTELDNNAAVQGDLDLGTLGTELGLSWMMMLQCRETWIWALLQACSLVYCG
ncbi:hypothetical protein AZE42_13845, partial [Rhizopogon vesiculosus]